MNIREPWSYTDPVIASRLVVHTDDRGFVQITIKHATDPNRVIAVRIRDEAFQGLIDELIAAQYALGQVSDSPSPSEEGRP
jgi:hypothetical protein